MLSPRLILLRSLDARKRRKRIVCFCIRWFTPGTRGFADRCININESVSYTKKPHQKGITGLSVWVLVLKGSLACDVVKRRRFIR